MQYNLVDLERTRDSGNITYWMPGARGYTNSRELAGIYTHERATFFCREDCQGNTVMYPVDDKKYKTWEALKILSENPKAEFMHDGLQLYSEDGIIKVSNDGVETVHQFTLNELWSKEYEG